ncbi:unnamed protein product [Merluccius merluccius]
MRKYDIFGKRIDCKCGYHELLVNRPAQVQQLGELMVNRPAHVQQLGELMSEPVYHQPPTFCRLPLAQWFETVHTNEVLGHLDEMKGIITSTYGRILKLDSTKKITKKLAGGIENTATWMSNIGNELGQVLNSVLTTGEGAGLDDLCQGVVRRYRDAARPSSSATHAE